MTSMDLLLAPFGPAPQEFDTPMEADALSRIRDPVSADNPLLDNVHHARAILGLGLYIARGVRTDCLFPSRSLSVHRQPPDQVRVERTTPLGLVPYPDPGHLPRVVPARPIS